jgi:hypothetical protein
VGSYGEIDVLAIFGSLVEEAVSCTARDLRSLPSQGNRFCSCLHRPDSFTTECVDEAVMLWACMKVFFPLKISGC